MNMTSLQKTLPTPEEVAIAKSCGRELSAYVNKASDFQRIEIFDEKGSHPVSIPMSALRLLIEVLTEIGEGNAVNIIPIHAELTTQEAADALNVSRPFFVKLLEEKKIPFHKTGTHRRVKYQDVMNYKNTIDASRSETLNELAQQAQALNMGY
jgi:excisionase family DNA binding protein